MSNSHFKRKSAVFECRHCGRRTRDTNGDNGRTGLCEDCYEGSMSENGWCDTDDEAEKAQCDRDMREAYQRAVDKGGVIDGYTASATKATSR